jgi:hypothetical protein
VNTFNPWEILGKNFLEIEDISEHNGRKVVLEDLEEGEKPEYYVSAKDETWEILLGKNNRVETIFLYLERNCEGILGITKFMNSADIIKLIGQPTESEEKQFVPILGEYGAWERYDFDRYCIHIEHNIEDTEVKQITIMLPEVAPFVD